MNLLQRRGREGFAPRAPTGGDLRFSAADRSSASLVGSLMTVARPNRSIQTDLSRRDAPGIWRHIVFMPAPCLSLRARPKDRLAANAGIAGEYKVTGMPVKATSAFFFEHTSSTKKGWRY